MPKWSPGGGSGAPWSSERPAREVLGTVWASLSGLVALFLTIFQEICDFLISMPLSSGLQEKSVQATKLERLGPKSHARRVQSGQRKGRDSEAGRFCQVECEVLCRSYGNRMGTVCELPRTAPPRPRLKSRRRSKSI